MAEPEDQNKMNAMANALLMPVVQNNTQVLPVTNTILSTNTPITPQTPAINTPQAATQDSWDQMVAQNPTQPKGALWYTRDGRLRTPQQQIQYLRLKAMLNKLHDKFKGLRLHQLSDNERRALLSLRLKYNDDKMWGWRHILNMPTYGNVINNTVYGTARSIPALFYGTLYNTPDMSSSRQATDMYRTRRMSGSRIALAPRGLVTNILQDYGRANLDMWKGTGAKAMQVGATINNYLGIGSQDSVDYWKNTAEEIRKERLKNLQRGADNGVGLAIQDIGKDLTLYATGNYATGAILPVLTRAAQISSKGAQVITPLLKDVNKGAEAANSGWRTLRNIGLMQAAPHIALTANAAMDLSLNMFVSPLLRLAIKQNNIYKTFQAGNRAVFGMLGSNKLERLGMFLPALSSATLQFADASTLPSYTTELIMLDPSRALKMGLVDKDGNVDLNRLNLVGKSDQGILRTFYKGNVRPLYRGIVLRLGIQQDWQKIRKAYADGSFLQLANSPLSLSLTDKQLLLRLKNVLGQFNQVGFDVKESNQDTAPKDLLNMIPDRTGLKTQNNSILNATLNIANATGITGKVALNRIKKQMQLFFAIRNADTELKRNQLQKLLDKLNNEPLSGFLINALRKISPLRYAQMGRNFINMDLFKDDKDLIYFMLNFKMANNPQTQSMINNIRKHITRGATDQYLNRTNKRTQQMLQSGDLDQALLTSFNLMAMQKLSDSDLINMKDSRILSIKNNLSKTIGKNIWGRPDKWHLAIKLWFYTKDMDGAGDVLGNPIVFWGGLVALLLGGTAMIGSALGGNTTNITNNYNGASNGYTPIHNFGGNGMAVGG